MAGSGADERAWIRGAQDGSTSAMEALFRHHWPRAYRAAYLVVHDSAAAEDIAQEAFLAAVRNLDRFDRRQPFGPWLHRIVVNRAIDWARARTLRREVGDAELDHAAPPEAAELADHTLEAVRSLPPEHRAVIVLRYLLEYTPGEIANLLDLPRGTVNSRLRRGLAALVSLPTSGRLLVQSAKGPWLVEPDGSRRLLGPYRDVSWSPHGLFLAATRPNELLALDPKGHVRWSLARPAVRFPRWTGSRTDTRIAYLSGSRLHLVAGDGTRDVDLCGEPATALVAPAWRPGAQRTLAYATTQGRVYVLDPAPCSLSGRSPRYPDPRLLAWSSD